jgi:predicted nucleic acid-binding protein
LILIDTSAWIAFFRDRGPVAAIVDQALEDRLATNFINRPAYGMMLAISGSRLPARASRSGPSTC